MHQSNSLSHSLPPSFLSPLFFPDAHEPGSLFQAIADTFKTAKTKAVEQIEESLDDEDYNLSTSAQRAKKVFNESLVAVAKRGGKGLGKGLGKSKPAKNPVPPHITNAVSLDSERFKQFWVSWFLSLLSTTQLLLRCRVDLGLKQPRNLSYADWWKRSAGVHIIHAGSLANCSGHCKTLITAKQRTVIILWWADWI